MLSVIIPAYNEEAMIEKAASVIKRKQKRNMKGQQHFCR